jgi:hypothetical protein
VLAVEGRGFLVLIRKGRSGEAVLRQFDSAGRFVRDVPTVRPLRVLLDRSDRGVRAIDIDGRLVEVLL